MSGGILQVSDFAGNPQIMTTHFFNVFAATLRKKEAATIVVATSPLFCVSITSRTTQPSMAWALCYEGASCCAARAATSRSDAHLVCVASQRTVEVQRVVFELVSVVELVLRKP